MKDTDATTKKIAKRLHNVRIERNLTQAQVADKADLNTNYYAKIERGEIRPSIATYEKLAKVLKITSSELFPF